MPSILTVRNVGKTYKANGNETSALSNVNLEVRPGEFVSVIGPNGSGKSTLLKIIADIIQTSSGTVAMAGVPAYMPQDHALLPWRTVEENLLLPCDVKGMPRKHVRGKVRGLLNEFGLEQYARRYPASLSGGTRQKIALLRAVLQDNALLLLDEPFAPLDAITRLETQTWLLSLVEKTHSSVLLITHDIREAIYLSDTIYVLNPRPGTIKEKLPVPLPRPRNHGHLQTRDALELEKRLFSLLV
ncbi:MAG: ABC transporter ATP-binding protein [bacterium]|nr:ABC transporter ATP-binding protein [bacterium]